jgi:hypothetical protein
LELFKSDKYLGVQGVLEAESGGDCSPLSSPETSAVPLPPLIPPPIRSLLRFPFIPKKELEQLMFINCNKSSIIIRESLLEK